MGLIGYKHTEDAKRRMSESAKRRFASQPHHLKGRKLSAETLKKKSETMKQKYADGYVNPMKGRKWTEEQLKQRPSTAGEKNPNFGKKMSQEQKDKISNSLKGEKNPNYGKKQSAEWIAKRVEKKRGKPLSKETRDKISESLKGEKNPNFGKCGDKHPMYGKKGVLNANFGVKRSAEVRKRMGENRKGKYTGEKSHLWNPDREYVKKRRALAQFAWNRLHLPFRSDVSDERIVKNLGFTKQEFYGHFDRLIEDRGWTWQQYGRKGWHIDHIKPISAFVKEGITDPKEINALENLQPLWCTDNWKKNSKYVEDVKI